MTQVTSDMLADMHQRRLRGESCADIARSYGIKEMTVYQRLRREHGVATYKAADLKMAAANDNHPDRVTRMMPHNGGCSTTSGRVPVTLARIPTIDGPFEVAA